MTSSSTTRTRTSERSSPRRWATKTNDVAGDGTTTATVLAQALVHEGLRAVAAGAGPVGLKRGIDAAVAAVEDRLRENAREVETTEDMAHVATISARDNDEIGRLIAEAFDKVGKDGVITVDESQTMGTELEFTRACSSTRVTSRRTSLPIRSGWRPSSTIPTS